MKNKLKALKNANFNNIVEILVDIIEYQDKRISELERIEKSKHSVGCTIPSNIQQLITTEDFLSIVKYNQNDDIDKLTDINYYDDIIISKDFIIDEVSKIFKEITSNIMNSESMTDVEFDYIYSKENMNNKYNDGYKLDFGVFVYREHIVNYDNSIKFIDGKIKIELCESIERCGIENEMIIKLEKLSKHLLKIGYPSI